MDSERELILEDARSPGWKDRSPYTRCCAASPGTPEVAPEELRWRRGLFLRGLEKLPLVL